MKTDIHEANNDILKIDGGQPSLREWCHQQTEQRMHHKVYL